MAKSLRIRIGPRDEEVLQNIDRCPLTAEQLMRSRYCAFVHEDEEYLLATWHPETRPSRVRFDQAQRWLGLKVYATAAGGPGGAPGR